MAEHPLVRGVAVSTDPVETGLLDPAWSRRLKPCLWDNHKSGTPQWVSLPAGWLETGSNEDWLAGEGPYPGGRHSYMKKGNFRLIIPNPHGSQIDSVLIKEILKQAGIDMHAWLNA